MVTLTKLVALTVLATASARELRGSNQQLNISRRSEELCNRETIIELTCYNDGRTKSEMVDMSCDEAKAAAPGMLHDFCGPNAGGRWSLSCNWNCPEGGGGDSISCRWVGGGTYVDCPGTFDDQYSENYTCENGAHICCTMSSMDSVRMTKLDSTCHRDTAEEETADEDDQWR